MNARVRSGFVVLSVLLGGRPAGAQPPESPPPLADKPPEISPELLRIARATSPLLRDTVAAALRAAGAAETRRMLASMAARTRSSALLPELWVRAARSTDDSLRLSPTVEDPYRYSALGGAGTWLSAGLAWHLDRLLFDRDEIAVERLRREHSERIGRLIGKVTAALFSWQRERLRAEDPKATEEDVERAVLARAEAEATLDLLTAGWFGKTVLESGRAGAAGGEPRR